MFNKIEGAFSPDLMGLIADAAGDAETFDLQPRDALSQTNEWIFGGNAFESGIGSHGVQGQLQQPVSQRQFSVDALAMEDGLGQLDYDEVVASSFTQNIYPRIVINDAIGGVGSREYAAAPEFNAIVQIGGGCTATLIDEDTVLTARHCGVGPGSIVEFGVDTSNPDYIATVSDAFNPAGGGPFSPLLDGGDFTIANLTEPVPASVATPMRLSNSLDLVGQRIATIGYGLNGVGSEGHQFSGDGFRWGGENIIDQVGEAAGTAGNTSNIISTDFDNDDATGNTIPGSNPIPLEFEATTAPGDSGGPILINNNGEWVIVGVLSGGTSPISAYGDISWWTGIAIYEEEIIAAGGEFVGSLPEEDDHVDDFPSPQVTFLDFQTLTGKFIARDDGTIGYGEEENTSERDIFAFVLGTDSRVIIDAKAKSFSLDTKLELFDVAGNLIASNDNSENPATPNETDSQISISNVPAGDYFVAVSSSADTTGDYRVAVRLSETPEAIDDVGNSFIGATIVEMSTEPGISFARAQIDYGEDRDFYRFIANQSGELIVRSKALGEANTLNTVLRAYDADRQKIGANNNFRGKLDSRLVLDVIEGEEYTVQLSSVGNTTGDYRVSLRFKVDEPNGGGFDGFERHVKLDLHSANANSANDGWAATGDQVQLPNLVQSQYENGLLSGGL